MSRVMRKNAIYQSGSKVESPYLSFDFESEMNAKPKYKVLIRDGKKVRV
jgi:hypothetical protein